MLSYDSLPKFKLSPIKSLYFRFGRSREPYEVPYIVTDGQIYLSLEHLVALGCGTRARPASGEANNSTSPCVANIGVDAAGFKRCAKEAIELGAKVIMRNGGKPYALGLPLSAIYPMLQTIKYAAAKTQVKPSAVMMQIQQNKLNRISELIESKHVNLTDALLIDAGLKHRPALPAQDDAAARQGDSVPEAGLRREPLSTIPNKVCSYTAQRIPTYPYFSWLY